MSRVCLSFAGGQGGVSLLLVIVSASSLLPPFVFGLVSLLAGHCVRLVPLLFPFVSLLGWSLCPPCFCLPSCLPSLCPHVSLLSPFASGLLPLLFPFLSLLVGHCVRLAFLLFLFVSGLVPLVVGHCVRLGSLLFPFVSLLVGPCVRLVSLLVSLCPSCLPCSPNSLLLGVLNALKNGRLGAGWSGRVPGRLVSHFPSPRLGACGRVPGWLVSHFYSFVSHFFSFVSHFLSFVSHFFSFVSQFFSFVSQAGCLWSGSRLACLPLPFICLPLLFTCLPVLFICLPGWVLVVGFPAGLSSTSFHLSPISFHLSPKLGACGRVPGWLVSHFLSCVSHFFSFVSHFFSLSPRLGACGRAPSRLVFHFLSFVSHFFPKQFTVRGSQFFLNMCLPFVSLLVLALIRWPCSMSIHLSPRSVTAGVRPFPLAM